ncbi:MAG: RdgB/HAM1 family non-canonical purine NTP pyrophosphatase [Saprospiraceae bacterium]
MTTLVFATHNAHKAREVMQILGEDYVVKTLADIGCVEEIPETGATLEENALIKARYVRDRYGYACFSEDTGLEVAALGGAPGVHTARFAGDSRDPQANMDLLLSRLEGHEDRSAQFRTVIALVNGEREQLFEGVCKGRIAEARAGDQGFGYDPVFVPDGYARTFAELGDAVKNEISHRSKAMRTFVENGLKSG